MTNTDGLSSSNNEEESVSNSCVRGNYDGESIPNSNLQETPDEENIRAIERVTAMTFADINEADAYYIEFGRLCGFDVRRDAMKRDKKGIANRTWVCSRQGTRQSRVEDFDRKREHKPETRCGCPATFRVALDRAIGRYRVTKFVPMHNHPMETPNTSHILRCNRVLTTATMKTLDTMTGVGVRPCQAMDLLEDIGGGSATGVLNRKDAYNYLNGGRLRRIEGGDVNTLLGILDGMKLKDETLNYRHAVDVDHGLTRIFWCDGISKKEYEMFGDVLIFDSTYKTNVYRFPVVMFSGVNSHLCTCIFGVAIMYKETTQQYIWLLRTFLDCMGGTPPKAVLTDQDAAMRAAIREVFPDATHRLCCWHISRNVESNIKKAGFSTEFSNLMNSTCSEAEFESRWSALVAKFGVADNQYLHDLYEKRTQWAEAYFRGKFFGMMRSTQRAESMNASLKRKARSGSTLTDFFRQYNNGFLGRIRKRFHALQTKSENVRPYIKRREGLIHLLQHHAATVCTRDVFKLIRNEISEEANVLVHKKDDPVNRRHTIVLCDRSSKKSSLFKVIVDLDHEEYSCECKTLESDGIPCRHLICAFKNLELEQFPPKTIHPRWSVDAGKQLISSLPYLYTDNANSVVRAKMTEKGIEFSNTSDDEDDCRAEGDSGGEDSRGIAKRTRNVRDPAKVIPKGGTKSRKQACRLCKQPGHKATTCELNPRNAGKSRARVDSMQPDSAYGITATDSSFVQPSANSCPTGVPSYTFGSRSSAPYNNHRQRYQARV